MAGGSCARRRRETDEDVPAKRQSWLPSSLTQRPAWRRLAPKELRDAMVPGVMWC